MKNILPSLGKIVPIEYIRVIIGQSPGMKKNESLIVSHIKLPEEMNSYLGNGKQPCMTHVTTLMCNSKPFKSNNVLKEYFRNEEVIGKINKN